MRALSVTAPGTARSVIAPGPTDPTAYTRAQQLVRLIAEERRVLPRVRAGIVQVPEGREVLARMTVEENLLMGLRGRDRAEIASAYERFPILRERRALLAGSLSGGEQQMLAIARALLGQPRLLLLDEPSLGLAPMIVKRVFDTLAELKRQGVTMLLVEQNALRALRLADRAYVMDLGRIVMRGTGPELLRDEGVARTYLGG